MRFTPMNIEQNEIIGFLNDPKSYGLPADGVVERFDTHISIVFLVGDFAYKLKRAIALPFVDFRELKDRHDFCQIELEINRRTSPKMYEAVIPVTRQNNGTFSFNKEGEVVEWLVKMKRFDQADLFENLAQEGKLTISEMEQLCTHIVDFYMKAEIDIVHGGSSAMKRAFAGHYKAFDNCPDHVLSKDLIVQLQERIEDEIAKQKGLLQDRQKTGYVRHCHGDLHLRNICIFQGEITLFDAIEFEPDYAIIDIFYDFVFLLMDLCHRHLWHLANALMNRYLGLTGDVAALNLLPLFMASRSAIRTHVNAFASQNQLTDQDRLRFETNAQNYLDEALSYLKPVQAKLIVVGGLSGSGKSVLAQKIAPEIGRMPGAFIARTDLIRKRLMKTKPEEKLSEYGYLPDVTAHTYNTLYVEVRLALNAGQSVIVDGVFAKAEEREMLKNIAMALDVPLIGIWLECEQSILKERVRLRKNDPSDADETIVEKQSNYDLGEVAWTKIDTNQTIENIYEIACQIIKEG
jgi:uncharacterized protein